MEKENDSYEKLKNRYETLKKKYSLPDFVKLEEEFEIFRIEKENDYLLREIRKIIHQKISAIVSFIESLLSPQPNSIFSMSLSKTINPEDRTKLYDNFKKLGEIEIKSFKLAFIYDEQEESKFIKYAFAEWEKIKKELHNISVKMEDNWVKEFEKKSKSYFG